MSVLSDKGMRPYLRKGMVDPYDKDSVQPASYELHLDTSYMWLARTDNDMKDVTYDIANRCFWRRGVNEFIAEDPDYGYVKVLPNVFTRDPEGSAVSQGIVLQPGALYIASTTEYLNIPNNIMARFEGKSSLGRVGLMVHITAGYVDPGFRGNLTLEIINMAPWETLVLQDTAIGQLSFHTMDSPVAYKYGSSVNNNHYQGQTGPTLPRP